MIIDDISKIMVNNEKQKTFAELKNGDYLFAVDIKTLQIHIIEATEVFIDNTTVQNFAAGEPREYGYSKIRLNINKVTGFIDAPYQPVTFAYGNETFMIDHSKNIVICTTRNEAEKIEEILKTKCFMQYHMFKQIFNQN